MYNEQQLNAFVVIDDLLIRIKDKGGQFITINKGSEYQLARKIIDTYELVTYRNPNNINMSIVDLAPEGHNVIAAGGIEKYLSNKNSHASDKERMEYELLQKSVQKIDLEIEDLVGKVADYMDNKWKTHWGFWISVVTLIVAIIALLK